MKRIWLFGLQNDDYNDTSDDDDNDDDDDDALSYWNIKKTLNW